MNLLDNLVTMEVTHKVNETLTTRLSSSVNDIFQ
jgi:hypothetical protein